MDVIDRIPERRGFVKIHIAQSYAMRRPESDEFVQKCSKCGRELYRWQDRIIPYVLTTNVVERGYAPGQWVGITSSSQYMTAAPLGANEEMCDGN